MADVRACDEEAAAAGGTGAAGGGDGARTGAVAGSSRAGCNNVARLRGAAAAAVGAGAGGPITAAGVLAVSFAGSTDVIRSCCTVPAASRLDWQ